MQVIEKAHEVCNKFKDKLEEDIEVVDVYVAINAQYHDYCELFEKWFGKGNFDEMIFESAIAFWLTMLISEKINSGSISTS